MAVNITGTLLDPMGIAEVATIRVTSTITGTGTLACSSATVVTGSDGTYNFNLVNGTFEIEVNDGDEFCLLETVAVDDSVLTNPSYTLQELILL